ncbi:MAG: hypothetical protein R3B84_24780 [Zavarzinella sp.]
MPYVTSFERLAKQEGVKEGISIGTDRGRKIGQIHAFEEILGLSITPVDELQQKSLDELDLMISQLKAKLVR